MAKHEQAEVAVDFDLPSAEGHVGYPEDLLELDADELRRLTQANGTPAPHNAVEHGYLDQLRHHAMQGSAPSFEIKWAVIEEGEG